MIIIKTLHFEDYEDFACAVSDVYDRVKSDDEYNSVDVIAKYEDAKEIIRELVGIGYGIAFINELANSEWDGYDDAFVISLLDDEIWCEPVKRKNDYIFVEADVVYIFDNCNSKIVPKIESDEVYEVEIGNEYDNCDDDCSCDECECDCKNCSCTDISDDSHTHVTIDKDDDGNIHGFTSVKSDVNGYEKHEFYSSEPIDFSDFYEYDSVGRLFDLLDFIF